METHKAPYDAALREALRRLDEMEATPLRHSEATRRTPRTSFSKIAAVVLAAAFLGGLTWAITPLLTSPTETSEVPAGPLPPVGSREEASPLVRFSDVRLDSILNVVSVHYGTQVCFRSEEPRAMKLITTWNPEDSLTAFIDHLNMFDCLRLTLQGDTIFVEQTSVED